MRVVSAKVLHMCNVSRYTGDSGDAMGGAKGGVKPIGKRWPTGYDNDVIAFLMFTLL